MRSSPPPFLLEEARDLTTDLPHATSSRSSDRLIVPSTITARKRRFSYTDTLSSDPLFSDDVSEAGVQLGDEHPRKRTVKCPWWELRARKMTISIAQRPARGTASRFRGVDSGVWMGSDDTASEDTFQETPAETVVDPSTLVAHKVIQSCLDDGRQVVDLSNLGLDDLTDDTLRPLRHLVPRWSTDHHRAPSEEEYRPLMPSIQLFLSSNRLSTLPLELLGLRLRVLSLWNNLLTQLPYNIEKLNGLQELNIAGNQLQYLPWGLFAIIRSIPPELMTLRPNPFLSLGVLSQNEYDTVAKQFEQNLRTARKRHHEMETSHDGPALSVFLATSIITRLGVDGTPCVRKNAQETSPWAPNLQHENHDDGDQTKVASLFELALRRAQQAQLPNDVTQLLPPDSPASLLSALSKAIQNQYHGNDKCSTCRREMLIPRAEWIEYWFHGIPPYALRDDNITPFLRRACSAQCSRPTASGTYLLLQNEYNAITT